MLVKTVKLFLIFFEFIFCSFKHCKVIKNKNGFTKFYIHDKQYVNEIILSVMGCDDEKRYKVCLSISPIILCMRANS